MTGATDDQDAVLRLFGSTDAVLFDFDGPVCDLFGDASTAHVAAKVKRVARRYWGRPLEQHVEACDDSHGILRRLREMYEQRTPKPTWRRPLIRAERIVAKFESKAVRTAVEAPHIVTLVTLLSELGKRLVIVSNNAEAPIERYLQQHGMHDRFERVFGRDPEDARNMKPHPNCIERALEHLSLAPSSCLLVGDQITDLEAAASAGTRFLGYTQDEVRDKEMRNLGAHAVVSSHTALVEAAESLISIRRTSAPAIR